VPLLQVTRLSKSYGPIAALSEVSFSLREGEILGLIGPNGAGKSTLFDCLAGLQPVDSGTITASQNADTLFYIPDSIAPWPAQSVGWMLKFITGFFGGRTDLRDEVIHQLDLTCLLKQPVGTLSKGQRKRALIAAGLLAPQPALLIDEPLDGLDLRQMRDIATTFRSHAKRGRTLFLSIHQISDAARLCDRFVLLSGGRVRGEGTIDELASKAGKSGADLEEVFLALT
jgi:ABC-2 type transport system ATP-binding protein